MIKQEIPEFGVVLATLAEIYGHDLSETVVEWYFELLKEFTLTEIEYAAKDILRTRTFSKFPLPADFITRLDSHALTNDPIPVYKLPDHQRDKIKKIRQAGKRLESRKLKAITSRRGR